MPLSELELCFEEDFLYHPVEGVYPKIRAYLSYRFQIEIDDALRSHKHLEKVYNGRMEVL